MIDDVYHPARAKRWITTDLPTAEPEDLPASVATSLFAPITGHFHHQRTEMIIAYCWFAY